MKQVKLKIVPAPASTSVNTIDRLRQRNKFRLEVKIWQLNNKVRA